MATLKDIGAELGLSVATVSRALNGFPEVKQSTKEKVRLVADRLGYRPNRTAQRLVTGKSGMVGMIVKIRPDLSADQTFVEILTDLTAALAARDTDLVLAVDEDPDPVAAYQRMLERDILDGFILNAPVPNDPRVTFLEQAGVPFVMHGQDRAAPNYPFYSINNRAVSGDAVRLLTALGHKRIALLNGSRAHAYATDRAAGFLAAMAEADLPVPAWSTVNDTSSDDFGYGQALAMLAGHKGLPPTAFVCGSTRMVAGVLRAIADRGLSVPGNVSVIAHDDALPQMRAATFDPALTMTHAPLRDACAPLANMLVDLIDGADPLGLQRLMAAEMIIGGSTGPAPPTGGAAWS